MCPIFCWERLRLPTCRRQAGLARGTDTAGRWQCNLLGPESDPGRRSHEVQRSLRYLGKPRRLPAPLVPIINQDVVGLEVEVIGDLLVRGGF
jgi:hypothetical protein